MSSPSKTRSKPSKETHKVKRSSMSAPIPPVIARSNAAADVRPFIEYLWVHRSEMCRSVFTDMFPHTQGPTPLSKAKEDAFICRHFTAQELYVQGGRFLMQVLYAIALYNDGRVVEAADSWSVKNSDLLSDAGIVKQIRSSVSLRTFFDAQDTADHHNDEHFLKRVMMLVQHRLLLAEKQTEDAAAKPLTPATEAEMKLDNAAAPIRRTPSNASSATTPRHAATSDVWEAESKPVVSAPVPATSSKPLVVADEPVSQTTRDSTDTERSVSESIGARQRRLTGLNDSYPIGLNSAHAHPPMHQIAYARQPMMLPMQPISFDSHHGPIYPQMSNNPPFIYGINFAARPDMHPPYAPAPIRDGYRGLGQRSSTNHNSSFVVDPDSFRRLSSESVNNRYPEKSRPGSKAKYNGINQPKSHLKSPYEWSQASSSTTLPRQRPRGHESQFSIASSEHSVSTSFVGSSRTDINEIMVVGVPMRATDQDVYECVKSITETTRCSITFVKGTALLSVEPHSALRELLASNHLLPQICGHVIRFEVTKARLAEEEKRNSNIYEMTDNPKTVANILKKSSHKSLQRQITNPFAEDEAIEIDDVLHLPEIRKADPNPDEAIDDLLKSSVVSSPSRTVRSASTPLRKNSVLRFPDAGEKDRLSGVEVCRPRIDMAEEISDARPAQATPNIHNPDKGPDNLDHETIAEVCDNVADTGFAMMLQDLSTPSLCNSAGSPSEVTIAGEQDYVAQLEVPSPTASDGVDESFQTANEVKVDVTETRHDTSDASRSKEVIDVEGSPQFVEKITPPSPIALTAGPRDARYDHKHVNVLDPISEVSSRSSSLPESVKQATIKTGPKQTESLSPFARQTQIKKKDKKTKSLKARDKPATLNPSRPSQSSTFTPASSQLADIFTRRSSVSTEAGSVEPRIDKKSTSKTTSPNKKAGFLQAATARLAGAFGGRIAAPAAPKTTTQDEVRTDHAERVTDPDPDPIHTNADSMAMTYVNDADIQADPTTKTDESAVQADDDAAHTSAKSKPKRSKKKKPKSDASAVMGLGISDLAQSTEEVEDVDEVKSPDRSEHAHERVSSTSSAMTLTQDRSESDNDEKQPSCSPRKLVMKESNIVQAPINKLLRKKKSRNLKKKSSVHDLITANNDTADGQRVINLSGSGSRDLNSRRTYQFLSQNGVVKTDAESIWKENIRSAGMDVGFSLNRLGRSALERDDDDFRLTLTSQFDAEEKEHRERVAKFKEECDEYGLAGEEENWAKRHEYWMSKLSPRRHSSQRNAPSRSGEKTGKGGQVDLEDETRPRTMPPLFGGF